MRIEFDKEIPSKICETRELAFFAGTAIGPIYGKGPFNASNHSGVKAALLLTSQASFRAYYHGGCTFSGNFSNCHILARFAELPNQPPAIVECQVGKGRAILSGVHLEISANTLDRDDPFLAPLIPLFEASEPERALFWNQLISRSCEKIS